MRPLGKPPNQRDNWHRINEGQRRYAYEQYNLARVRRGLSIDHPIPEHEEGGDDLDRILDEPAEGEQQLGQEIEEQLQAEADAIEDFDETLFDEHSESVDHQHNNTSHSFIMADSSGVPSTPTGSKRGPSDDGAGPPAKNLFANKVGRSRLPGTARDQGSSGTPEAEGGPRLGVVIKPSPSIQEHVRYFRKVHRLYTYGVPYIASFELLQNTARISSPLCYVPWDKLYLYLNKSEVSQLPRGSSVAKVKITILQRNVRVAFQTNSSENAIATLNQNKNIITAVGLNKNVEGTNRMITIGANNIVTGTTAIPATWDNAIETEMYGSEANVTNTMPRHQFGQPQVWNAYYCPQYHSSTTTLQQDGWQCFQSFVNEMDADSSKGNVILEQTYEPRVGLCKLPPKAIYRATPNGDFTVNRGPELNERQTTTITTGSVLTSLNQPTNSTSDDSAMNQNWGTTFDDNIQMIEKSQMMTQGLFKRDYAHVQPSIHVGIQPSYALNMGVLNGNASGTTNSSFTDVQALFEISAECWVNTSAPTFRPLTLEANTTVNNFWQRNATYPNFNQPTIAGLYRN